MFSSTNSTRSQRWPPSVVRKTPRSCCGPVSPADGAGEDDVGVRSGGRRRGRSGRSPSRPMWAHVLPASDGLVDPVADHVDVADGPGLAGARPDDRRVGRRDGQGADGGDLLVVEDRLPVDAAVRGLPDAAAMPRRHSRCSNRPGRPPRPQMRLPTAGPRNRNFIPSGFAGASGRWAERVAVSGRTTRRETRRRNEVRMLSLLPGACPAAMPS